jgi:hypothetical protein
MAVARYVTVPQVYRGKIEMSNRVCARDVAIREIVEPIPTKIQPCQPNPTMIPTKLDWLGITICGIMAGKIECLCSY